MRWSAFFLLFFLTASAVASPAEAVAASWMDIERVPKEDRQYVRYQTLYAIPEKDREDFLKVLAFTVNSLSRKRALSPIRPYPVYVAMGGRSSIVLVTRDLIRLDIRNYGWDREVYEKLASVDPYFHLNVRIDEEAAKEKLEEEKPEREPEAEKPDLSESYYMAGENGSVPSGKSNWAFWAGGEYSDGVNYPKGWYSPTSKLYLMYKGKIPVKKPKPITIKKPTPIRPKKLVQRNAAAPWANPHLLTGLIRQTQSEAPVLRADWFFVQVAINKDRVAGYYAFLGLKSRKDFEKLAGFDLAKAQAKEREIASIIQVSGVSIRNRQVYRFGTVDRGYWQTRDVFERQNKERNAVNSLNGDYVHQAEEYFTPLANDLFAYYLSDKDGNQQDSAPDDVGGDSTTTNNDFKIHIFLSCVRCHVEGLRPLNDYGRRLFQSPALLSVYDKKKFERLEQLYLLPLQRDQDRDNQIYKDALADLNGVGWTPARNAVAVKKAWKVWAEELVTPEIAARELGGITGEELQKRLIRYAASPKDGGLGQLVPNVMLAFVHARPLPMLREHFEEVFHIFNYVKDGYVPAQLDEKK